MESYNELISIGLPVVKYQFLEETLKSALVQTYTNFEIILVNNAADEEVRIQIRLVYDSYKDDDRIRYIEHDKQFPMVENWNKVLEYAKGDFFTLLSDDDLMNPNFLLKLHQLSLKYPATNVFYSRLARINLADEISSISPCGPEYEDVLDLVYHFLYGFRHLLLSVFLIRTKSIQQIGGFTIIPNGIASDSITFCRLAEKGGIVCCPEILFYYRESNVNTSNSTGLFKWLYGLDAEYKYIINIVNAVVVENNLIEIKKRMIMRVINNRFRLKKITFTKRMLEKKLRLPTYFAFILSGIFVILLKNHSKVTYNFEK